MKQRYFVLAGLLLAGSAAHAQQPWQPFRPGTSYQYHEATTPGDTTHVLRLQAGAPVAGSATDSLFRFTARAGGLGGPRNNDNCGGLSRLRPDNLFGASLRSQPQAVFTLAAANGRTLTLRPRAPLGQSWATSLPGLAASVTARATAPVLGAAVPDSVVTITFSDGRSLRLSKSYGLLDGPSLDSYLNGRNSRRSLTLSALPERGLGTALTTDAALYNYQPGDIFQRTTEYRILAYNIGLCQRTWRQDSIVARQPSRTGDTVTYTARTWVVQRNYGATGGPFNLCSAPVGITYSAATTTWKVTGLLAAPNLTAAFKLLPNSVAGQQTTALVTSSTQLGGRPSYSTQMLVGCTRSGADSTALTYVGAGDWQDWATYAVGLGQTYKRALDMNEDNISRLTGYRKGSQVWGTFVQPATLLAARDVQPAATTTAFPTPFAESLTASFTLNRPQAVAATLYDALGRSVRQLPAQPLAAGVRQLSLPTAELPAGLYTLHLHFLADGHREVLKVVK